MKRFLNLIYAAVTALLFLSCQEGTRKEMPLLNPDALNVILDTDLGNDIDDIIAMDILYKYQDMGKVNFLSVMLNKEGRYAHRYADILNTWYGYPNTPIGIITDAAECYGESGYYTKKTCLMTDESGNPLFKGSLDKYYDLPEAVTLYRKILSTMPDGSVTIASVGFSTNLARLLESGPDMYSPLSGVELVKQKVRLLSVMAGNFQDPSYAEFNVVKDIPAAQKVFKDWPGQIVVSPWELGVQVRYPYASIESDFSWAKNNPAVEGYKNYRAMPYDSPTWDPTAVLYAVDNDGYFTESEPGTIAVQDSGTVLFTPSASGLHRYLSISEQQIPRVVDHFVKTFSQKPKWMN